MQMKTRLVGVVAAGLMAFPVMAQTATQTVTQTATPDGQYGLQLNRMLTEAADGTCLEALMAPDLLSACNGQIAAMSQGLKSLGAVESMAFVSAQDTPAGRVETWSVKYAGGQSLSWIIGQQQPDGKFAAVGTAG